jgi:CRISPR-associated protein Csb1
MSSPSQPTLDSLLAGEGPRRLVIEAHLKPVAGDRFQPAGFPEVGHVIYDAPRNHRNGDPARPEQVCIVDSAASMANHLEKVCWDEVRSDLQPDLEGLPYVRLEATRAGEPNLFVTCSILQDHRIASSYFIESACREPGGQTLGDYLHQQGGFQATAKRAFLPPANRTQAIRAIFRLDPNSLVHGTFFPQKKLGNFRLARLLTAHCEAFGARRCASSGVKFDAIGFKHAKDTNYGQSIFQRDEETAQDIVASFVVDLQQLRGFGLETAEGKLLLGLCLWKINAFLRRGTRLRSSCDLAFVPPASARLDDEPVDGDTLLALAEPVRPLLQAAFPGDGTSRAFVVQREYAELLRKAGQGTEDAEKDTDDEQPEGGEEDS